MDLTVYTYNQEIGCALAIGSVPKTTIRLYSILVDAFIFQSFVVRYREVFMTSNFTLFLRASVAI